MYHLSEELKWRSFLKIHSNCVKINIFLDIYSKNRYEDSKKYLKLDKALKQGILKHRTVQFRHDVSRKCNFGSLKSYWINLNQTCLDYFFFTRRELLKIVGNRRFLFKEGTFLSFSQMSYAISLLSITLTNTI